MLVAALADGFYYGFVWDFLEYCAGFLCEALELLMVGLFGFAGEGVADDLFDVGALFGEALHEVAGCVDLYGFGQGVHRILVLWGCL